MSAYLYQMGRLVSYTILGGILGWIGKGANAIGELKEIQGLAAILSLSLLFLAGVRLALHGKNIPFLPFFSKIFSLLFSYLKRKNQLWALGLSLGLFSAFLPCGVLYPAYAVAFASGSVMSGTLVMGGFFLGTFPALLSLSLGIGWLQRHVQPKYVTLVGIFIIFVSLVFLTLRVTHTVHSENCEHTERF
jgi:sulfite exporter TauE/SafE